MIRHCDGNDVTLSKKEGDRYIPCDCGYTFDDVDHMVIYPHLAFTPGVDIDKYIDQLGQ